MYTSHATAIQAHVERNGAEAFKQVALFVLATIRVPLYAAASCTRNILEGHDTDGAAFRRVIWGHKRAGLEYLESNFREVHRKALMGVRGVILAGEWKDERRYWEAQLLIELAKIPGIGLAKAGFLAQLCWGISGCLDTHNLRNYGIDANVCSLPAKLKHKTKLARASKYSEIVEQLGGTEHLWDEWCKHVARTQPKRYTDANHVSLLHCAALGIKP